MSTASADSRMLLVFKDLRAGLVVFLVALPLCLGVALASKAPPISGLVAGIVGGIVVGLLSRSHTSVSGPAAGLTAVVAVQITELGLGAFLLAVVVAGFFQIVLGLLRAGSLSAFFPSAVIKGLLAAIGILLILKQLPHLLGDDRVPEGSMAFQQEDQETTFSEIFSLSEHWEAGAAAIGLSTFALLLLWDRIPALKKSLIPAPLVIVAVGIALVKGLARIGEPWALGTANLVEVPVAASLADLLSLAQRPDFSQWLRPGIYVAAVTLALVASLETLLNVEAVDKLDPQKRSTSTSHELIAQGVGNVTSGLLGGLPVTSVIVRSSVNINAGAQSKLSAIFHGILLVAAVGLVPGVLNLIPKACLAAILIHTGIKLASIKLIKQMWNEGWNQFLPFAVTVIAIILTDLLVGVCIGLVVSVGFILRSNLRRPLRRILEKHVGGEVLRIELANQVSFLNRAALTRCLDEVQAGGHVLIDARGTDYIDPDILDLLREYQREIAPARGVEVSLIGFQEQYRLEDRILFADYTSRGLRDQLTPAAVLRILKDGNERFRSGQRLYRDLHRQVCQTAEKQYPLAVILACIDSRAPAEIIFDLGLGDIFSVRIAGNVAKEKVLGSLEYSCNVAGAKLILVMGHTGCGAVRAALDLAVQHRGASEATGCEHLDALVDYIQKSITPAMLQEGEKAQLEGLHQLADLVAERNVRRTRGIILEQSPSLARLVSLGQLAVVGAMYDLHSGEIRFLDEAEDQGGNT